MSQTGKPKWQKDVEEILRKKLPGDKFERQMHILDELVALASKVKVPHGDTGRVISNVLKAASEDLRPISAAYAGFQLGVAFERYQNVSQSQGK